MRMSKILKKEFDSSAVNRARIERALLMFVDMIGFNSDYVSLTTGVKPDPYIAGAAYGWYPKEFTISSGQHVAIQPVQWNAGTEQWDDIAQSFATTSFVQNFATELITDILNNNLSDLFNAEISEKALIRSDIKDGSEENVTSLGAITNIIPITSGEYDDLEVAEKLNPTTLYLIKEDEN